MWGSNSQPEIKSPRVFRLSKWGVQKPKTTLFLSDWTFHSMMTKKSSFYRVEEIETLHSLPSFSIECYVPFWKSSKIQQILWDQNPTEFCSYYYFLPSTWARPTGSQSLKKAAFSFKFESLNKVDSASWRD